MNRDHLNRLKEELLRWEALSPAEREARLAELGRSAPELERELRSLLERAPIAEPTPSGVEHLLAPLLGGATDTEAGPALRQIGPYRLIEVLGVGGMGIVYRAEQREPLRREVAIKLLRGGLDPTRVLARFTAERRAMALLEHPAIARILDAGLDVDGMPYLVTELVRGAPISDYCRDRKLPVPEVLRLFIEVCRAVQHAHQKGIIHRDLKPSNLLITEVDGAPRPKVIDFGIARILEEEAGAGATLTAEGQVIGTLGYMSPEQAAGARGVDTRADVYSLGALLYELLTGSLPHALEGMGVGEALAIIVREPPRAFRELSVKPRTLDGELETIVMKALAREPERRYEGAGALADDLERYLRHDAILARPPSATYVLRKLVRRHQAAFVLGAVAIMLLATFGIGMAMLYAGQRRERQRAETEAKKATATNDFLQAMLGSANPREKHVDVQVREVLEDAARRLELGAIRDPEVEAALRRTLGNTYLDLGDYERAEEQLMRAVELRRRARGPDDPLVAESFHDLAAFYLAGGAEPVRLARADSLSSAALRIRRDAFGEERAEVAVSLEQRAEIHRLRYQLAAAESLETRAMAILARTKGQNCPEMIHSSRTLAGILMDRSRIAAAESLYRRSVAIARARYRADHPEIADALAALGQFTLGSTHSLRTADSLSVEVLAMEHRMWGAQHTRVAAALNQLARVRMEEGRLAEAESLSAKAFRIEVAIHGEGTFGAAEAHLALADAQYLSGNYPESERHYRTAISIWKGQKVETAGLGMALTGLGKVLERSATPGDEWYRVMGEGVAVIERVWGPDHVDVASCRSDFADALSLRGMTAEAESQLRRAIAIRMKLFGKNDPFTPASMMNLGFLTYRQDRLSEAEALYRKSLALQTSSSGEIWNGLRLDTTSNLGVCLYHEGRLQEAEVVLRQTDREWRKHRGLQHPRYHWLLSNLGSLLLDRGKLHEADSLLTESLRLQRLLPASSLPKWRPWTQNARGALAALEGRQAAADSLFRISSPLAWSITALPASARRIARDRYERYRTPRGKVMH